MLKRLGLYCWPLALLLLAAVPALAQQPAAPPAEPVPAAGEAPAPGASAYDLMFYLFGGIAALSALGVVFSTNFVRTTVWLFGALSAVAVLFFLLGANLLGAIQLIVYVGGVLILIVFGVMLTSKSPWMRFEPRPVEIIGGCAVCLVLLIGLSTILAQTDWSAGATVQQEGVTVAAFGRALLTDYLLPFEVASVLLLAVMVGAAYLARPEK